jgi:hypothetical protein
MKEIIFSLAALIKKRSPRAVAADVWFIHSFIHWQAAARTHLSLSSLLASKLRILVQRETRLCVDLIASTLLRARRLIDFVLPRSCAHVKYARGCIVFVCDSSVIPQK